MLEGGSAVFGADPDLVLSTDRPDRGPTPAHEMPRNMRTIWLTVVDSGVQWRAMEDERW
jgi:hypothetical protein